MISVGNIAGLIALSALIVPVIIHLLSRKTKNTIAFGSLQFLEQTETKTLRSLQLNDVWLLILRSLIVIFLALIVADLLYPKDRASDKTRYLIDPYYHNNRAVSLLADTVDKEHIHWLAKGYPLLADSANRRLEISFSKLPEEWSNDSLVAISPLFLNKIEKKLPNKPLYNHLISLPVDDIAYDYKSIKKGDSAVKVQLNESEAILTTKLTSSTTGEQIDYFYQLPSYLNDNISSILRSAINSINKNSWINIKETDQLKIADLLIDTSMFSIKNNITPKKVILIGKPVLQKIENVNSNLLLIDENLTPVQALTSSLPIRLEQFMFNGLLNYKNDIRSAPVRDYYAGKREGESAQQRKKGSAAPILWWLAVILIFIERGIIAGRKA